MSLLNAVSGNHERLYRLLFFFSYYVTFFYFFSCFISFLKIGQHRDFPGGAVVKNRLPMQGTRVQLLVWEDPTCHGATKPVRHNY